ncbi:hypothetical protein HHI36_013590 [Cryptolaemus montrouzieri]|uniref:Reverse transcriptase domain-containing protein n=1 Tax=Cryptolaemus montrouzieri TaxID=559131 RepID=A0ABD2NHN2_9CUCU
MSYSYADDSNLMVKSRKIETIVQTARDALEKTGDWCNNNNLVLNMGIHIDLNMKWEQHIKALSKRLSTVVYSLHILKYRFLGGLGRTLCS